MKKKIEYTIDLDHLAALNRGRERDDPRNSQIVIGPKVLGGFHAVLVKYGTPVVEFVITPGQAKKALAGKGRVAVTDQAIDKARTRWGYPSDFEKKAYGTRSGGKHRA